METSQYRGAQQLWADLHSYEVLVVFCLSGSMINAVDTHDKVNNQTHL